MTLMFSGSKIWILICARRKVLSTLLSGQLRTITPIVTLPFFGLDTLRQAASNLVGRQSGQPYNWKTECVISAGGLSGILNVLLATLEPGDEVLMTDPVYVGLINRVRLAGGVPHFVPLIPSPQGWRLDIAAVARIDPAPVKVALLMSPSMPTGAVFDRHEWRALIDFCHRAQC
jgi:N-succinyldiaminopimelate aminotransferase